MAGLIRIGRGLAGNMSFPANGLQGQVIIDAEMVGAAWTGNVTIGSTTLSHTNGVYTNLPSTLGGGAVGLAPFQLHETACTPPHNQVSTPGSIIETTSFANEGDVPVIITNFGHIRRNPSTTTTWNDAVDIECIAHGLTGEAACTWTLVTQAFKVRGPGDAGWTDQRSLGLSRAPGMFPKSGIFRVALRTDRVQCVDVTGNPSVIWPENCGEYSPRFAYVFRVEPDCDGDGIGDFVDPDITSCGVDPCDVDFDGSGQVDVLDIFAFLTAWFQTNTFLC